LNKPVLKKNKAFKMSQESFELDPEEYEWLESIAKMYGLPPDTTAEALLQSAIERRRDKPEEPTA
jgi:hypothetical protein